MSDEPEPIASATESVKPLSHGRILKLMAVLGIAGAVLGVLLVSASFGAGVLAGALLAFVNYYWLRHSLKKLFALAAETGERPRLGALKYLGRYVVLAGIVAILYATSAVSVVGLLLGIGSFGFAVVIEGFLRIFFRPAPEDEL